MNNGVIEIICGPMFSGKTEELIRRIRRVEIAKQEIQIFKPVIDKRYMEDHVVSHIGQSKEAIPVKDSLEILEKTNSTTRVVAIDEIQFFDLKICDVITKLADQGIRVICAGLDQDHKGLPFGPVPFILAIADIVDKVNAVCTVCGQSATKSQRKDISQNEQILLGETDLYEARCRKHFRSNNNFWDLFQKQRTKPQLLPSL